MSDAGIKNTSDKVGTKEKEDKKEKFDIEKEYKRRIEIAEKFTKKLVERFKKQLKFVVIYGSTATKKFHSKSDLDTFLVMDDTLVEKEISPVQKDQIWNDILNIAKEVDPMITVQSFMFLTEFWDNVRLAEPLIIGILKSGVVVYDVGIFMPAKRMVERGKISLTKEAIDKKLSAAPEFVKISNSKIKSVGHYLEQAMAHAGNAALMFMGYYPVKKEEVPQEIKTVFVDQKIIEYKYYEYADKIQKLAKDIEHAAEQEMYRFGKDIGEALKMCDDFVVRMETLIGEMDQKNKGSVLMNLYKTLLKADVGALKYIGVMPPEKLDDLPKVLNENFPELKISHNHLFDRLTELLNMVRDGKEREIDEKEIKSLDEKLKDYVKKLTEVLKTGKHKPANKDSKVEDFIPKV